MENRLANSAVKLAVQMDQVIPGVVKLGAVLNLRADLANLLMGEQAELWLSNHDFIQAKLALTRKRRELEAALKTGRTFATLVRLLRKESLGSRYSQSWNVLGFQGNTQVPLTADGMSLMLGTMAGHLEKHPELDFGLTINAAQAKALQTELKNAKNAVNKAKSTVVQLFQARAKVVTRVRRLLRKILNDLAYEMDPLDRRWIEFGFNQPGVKATPQAPEDVKVIPTKSGALVVTWPPVARAERYRVWVKVLGVDTEMKAVGSSSNESFMMEEVPSDADLEIGMTAVNKRGESPMSAVITVKTPPAVLPTEHTEGHEKVE